MPTRYTKQGELQQFQYEIANEIRRDAKPIADGVFGANARHPDIATLSNAELDQMYRDAYARNDRTFLMQEAQRDPQQFLAVTDRLGVEDPPTDRTDKPIPSAADADALAATLQQQAAQNVVQAAPPIPPPGAAAPAGPGAPLGAGAPLPAALPSPGPGPMTQMPLPGLAPQV
jgi:hypothetical protein